MVHAEQLTLNEFETAILRQISRDNPTVLQSISDLSVLSREFTGVGSYTKFRSAETSEPRTHLSLDLLIEMPGVPIGMGAVLFLVDSKPQELEIYTYGDPWDGKSDGFTIIGAS